MIGTTIAHYQITEKLGEGGMGVVYRARDTKLGRDVAIKVLSQEFSLDRARIERFEREARVLASLNHPNIGAIHGIEEAGGRKALVLELAEGETLAERIERGALPVDEALDIARQIAEALEAAHEKGIIHRDLKPGNIMVSSAGQVKVLDFGLAKALESDMGESDPEHSPTITMGATRAGVIMGTAGYMSPEQARGKPVDRRADIWAFGVVLYEMLTGRRAFVGETTTDVLASVVKEEPDWTRLPAETPHAIRRLLRRCLAKDKRDRLQAIGDARLEASEALDGREFDVVTSPKQSRMRLSALAWIVPALLVAAAAGYWIARTTPGNSPHPANDLASRTVIDLRGHPHLAFDSVAAFVGYNSRLLDISPDGRRIVYIGLSEDGGTKLYRRDLMDFGVSEIPGTEGAIHPFFSPDGKSVGFLTGDKVKRVSLDGDAPLTLCDANTPVAATWATDGAIYFTERETVELSRVGEMGGAAELVGPQQPYRAYGNVLPDGRHAFLTDWHRSASGDYADILLLNVETGETRPLVSNGYDAQYAAPGHLLFGRAGDLYVVEFDLGQREVTGRTQRVAAGVRMNSLFSRTQAAVSDNGVLVHVPGGDAARGKPAWVDRQGQIEFLPLEERVYGQLDLSKDGKKLAIHVTDVNDYIQIYDLDRGVGERIAGPASSGYPVLSPGGDSVAYTIASIGSGQSIAVQRLGSGSSPVVLHTSELRIGVSSWTPDGKQLVSYSWPLPQLILELRPGGSLSYENTGDILFGFLSISPDGGWIAISEDGEIRVRSVDGSQRHQIAPSRGIEPMWCEASNELFYRSGNQWFSSKVSTTPDFQWEQPRMVFDTDFIDTSGWSYDVSPDGQRLLVVKRTRELPRDKIHVVQNWTALLEDQ